jgi:DNA-binding response OmpR family regulator
MRLTSWGRQRRRSPKIALPGFGGQPKSLAVALLHIAMEGLGIRYQIHSPIDIRVFPYPGNTSVTFLARYGDTAQALKSEVVLMFDRDRKDDDGRGKRDLLKNLGDNHHILSDADNRIAQDMQRTILVVENDAPLRDTLAYNLRAEGYQVLAASDGVTALEIARQKAVSLVLLDLMLPRLDGLEVCRQLRSQPETADVAIIMLTARAEETDKVVGLELGADDYVTKPYAWNELRARIRALLRRCGRRGFDRNALGGASQQLAVEDLKIDLNRREVLRHGEEIILPARLFDLLVCLMQNCGIVLTRRQLAEKAWGYDYEGDLATINVYIRLLREHIEDDPANPRLIQTVRGVGYRLRDERQLRSVIPGRTIPL